jgi:thiosulfate/3-mercaptopyruvate sulfurtransferase
MPFWKRIEDIQIKELEPLTSKPSLAILIVLPNTVPNSEAFATACRKIGIHNGSKIVVYDTKEFIRPKGVVAFKVMGHEKV